MNTNTKVRTIAPLVAVAALLAVPAQAEVIAGWDFSQYRSSASLVPFANTLPANYSDRDPTGNAGAESASYGTLHFDGAFGSSNTLTDFLPTAGSMNCQREVEAPASAPDACAQRLADGPVRSNRSEPWSAPGLTAFEAHSRLRAEGQAFQNLLGMTPSSNLSVVFVADLTPDTTVGTNWTVSFGGRTATGGGPGGGEQSCDPPGCSSTVGVDFSDDGVSYSSAGSIVLTPEDTRFEVSLGGVMIPTAFVRLNFNPTSGTPIIDNVAVDAQTLPEPGTSAGLLAGGALLALLARRRRA